MVLLLRLTLSFFLSGSLARRSFLLFFGMVYAYWFHSHFESSQETPYEGLLYSSSSADYLFKSGARALSLSLTIVFPLAALPVLNIFFFYPFFIFIYLFIYTFINKFKRKPRNCKEDSNKPRIGIPVTPQQQQQQQQPPQPISYIICLAYSFKLEEKIYWFIQSRRKLFRLFFLLWKATLSSLYSFVIL